MRMTCKCPYKESPYVTVPAVSVGKVAPTIRGSNSYIIMNKYTTKQANIRVAYLVLASVLHSSLCVNRSEAYSRWSHRYIG